MPRRRSTTSHAHRIPAEGEVECECGKTFDDDAAWRKHYESETTAAERRRLEGREDADSDA